MNMKKIAILALSLCMIAAIAVTGTIAYFTDTDKADNVFTLGSLDIVQNEYQRTFGEDEDGNTITTGITEFVGGELLMPITGSAQGLKDQYGMPVTPNYADKIVTVENKSDSAAWVRTFVLAPKAMSFVEGSGATANMTESPLHGNVGNRFDKSGQSKYNEGSNWRAWYEWDWDHREAHADVVEINGIDYELTVYYKIEPLAGKTESHAVITGYYLDNGIDCIADDNGKVTKYIQRKVDDKTGVQDMTAEPIAELNPAEFLDAEGKLHVYCYTQAVQAAGFATAQEAFDASGWNKDGKADPAFVKALFDTTL